MKRRTFAEVAAEARAEERSAIVEYLRGRIALLGASAEACSPAAADAGLMIRRLNVLADAIGQGLHRDDPVADLRKGGVL